MPTPVETVELSDAAGVLLLACRDRWRQRVVGGELYCVDPLTGLGLRVSADALTELEDAKLALIPVGGEPRLTLTPRGGCAARMLAKHLCGDGGAKLRLRPGHGEELPKGE